MINEDRLEILEKKVELMEKTTNIMSSMEDNFITQIDILSKMCELLYERVERLEGKNEPSREDLNASFPGDPYGSDSEDA